MAQLTFKRAELREAVLKAGEFYQDTAITPAVVQDDRELIDWARAYVLGQPIGSFDIVLVD